MHLYWRFTSLLEQSRYLFFFSPGLGNLDFYRYIAHPYIIRCDFTVTDRAEQLSFFFFAGLAFSNLSALRISFLRRGRRIFTAFPSIMDTQLFLANGNDCGFIFAPFSLVGRVDRMSCASATRSAPLIGGHGNCD